MLKSWKKRPCMTLLTGYRPTSENTTMVDNEAEILVDRLTTTEGARDVPVEEIDQYCNESPDRPLPALFLTWSIPVSPDKTEPVRAAFRGLLHTFGGEGDDTETVIIMCFTLNICVLIFFEIFKTNEKVDATAQEGDRTRCYQTSR